MTNNVFGELFEQSLTVEDVLAWRGKTFLFLDLGSGNSSAAKLKFDDASLNPIFSHTANGLPGLIPLNRNNDKKVYSIFCCDGEKFAVGVSAMHLAAPMISDFKIAPTDGNLVVNVEGTSMTHGEAMTKFTGQLFEDICSYNPDISKAREKGSLFLAAAHPSGEWPVENFRAMLHEASGVPVEHILTIKESRAAIQYAKARSNLRFDEGLLILDFGAYSIDATYIHAGKRKTWDASLPLGGRRIEENMLAILLANVHLTRKDIQDIPRSLQQLRFIKERRYLPEGEKSKVRDNRKIPLTKGIECPDIDEEMIHSAVCEFKFKNVRPNGPAVDSSWIDHVRAFLNFTYSELQRKGLPVQKVIVIGGVSAMTEVFEAVQQQFSSVEVNRLDAPAGDHVHDVSMNQSVPIGSALHFAQSYRVISTMPKLTHDVKEFVKTTLSEDLAEECSPALVDSLWEHAVIPAAKAWTNTSIDRSLNDLVSEIEMRLGWSSVTEAMKNSMHTPVQNACNTALPKLRSIAEDFYRGIYGRSFEGIVKVNAHDIGSAVSNVTDALNAKLSELLPPDVLINALDGIWPVIGGIIILIIMGILVWMFWYVFLALGVLGWIADTAKDVWHGLRKMSMNDEERAQYEAELKAEALKEAQEEAKAKEAELEENMSKPQSARMRGRVLEFIIEPESEAKTKAADELKAKLKPAVAEQAEKADFFGIPDAVITALQAEITNAIYVG